MPWVLAGSPLLRLREGESLGVRILKCQPPTLSLVQHQGSLDQGSQLECSSQEPVYSELQNHGACPRHLGNNHRTEASSTEGKEGPSAC